MRFSATTLLALSSTIVSAQGWGSSGSGDWGGYGGFGGLAPDCAVRDATVHFNFCLLVHQLISFLQKSCFSSAYSTLTTSMTACPMAASSLSSCVTSACSTITSVAASLSSYQSQLCSAWSSCSSDSQGCGEFGWGADGWGGRGPNGFYTYTCTNGRSSGFTTRTQTFTTTTTANGIVSTFTTTRTQEATLVAAAVSGTGTASSTSISRADAVGGKMMDYAGAGFVAAGAAVFGLMVAL